MADGERSTRSQFDGIGLASLVAGGLAIFVAERVFPPFGRDVSWLLIALLLPVAGLLFAYIALARNVNGDRDRQFAVAGALLSAVGALMMVLFYVTGFGPLGP